ncbi:MAG: mercury(II) reductase [Thaumarchaeota archaeon]|nr:mercury(II) reductase [Nitrososphaerota archaeon]
MEEFDFVIIGSGSAAFAAAIKASEFDAKKVAMIERGTIGGTCVNVGCVPSKRLLTVGETYYYNGHDYKGVEVKSGAVDLESIVKQKDDIVLNLRTAKYSNVVESLPNTKFIKGLAQFISKNQVKVNSQVITGKKFLIATGSTPSIPKIEGIDQGDYLTNVEALSLKDLPETMLIVGGRALALEFAQIYAHLGTEVTLLQRSSRIVPEEEPEISDALRTYLEEEGIIIHTGVSVKKIENRHGSKVITAGVEGRGEKEFEGEQVLMATGRTPNTFGLGLERTGVKLSEEGAILVDDEMKTTAPHIWAAGDVLGKPMLETVAAKEGSIAAENALATSNTKRTMDFSAIPHAIFTMPQVASVGLTDAEAVAKGYQCNCSVLDMSLVPKAQITGDTRGLVKMVIDNETGRILGVHILSALAADIIHEAVLAVNLKLTIDYIIDTVHIFPTMAESIKLVAQSFRKDISKMSCCTD